MNKGTLYWITGLAGAGKTTIGTALYYALKDKKENVVLLDGDILKKIVGGGYSAEERMQRALRYTYLCQTLTNQGLDVICCTIAMFEEIRTYNRESIRNYIEIFLDVPLEILRERDRKGLYSMYDAGKVNNLAGMDVESEYPKSPDLVIENNGTISVYEIVQTILHYEKQDYSGKMQQEEIKYWNEYYLRNDLNQEPTLFAQYIMKYVKRGKRILDIGCGNGRDSLFFASKGLKVSAVDSSEQAIANLKSTSRKDILFICDDFVNSKNIYQQQYDYCYSRFTMHAINYQQQELLLNNIVEATVDGGYFFCEMRGHNNELYGKGVQTEKDTFFYNYHHRRFVKKEEFDKVIESYGFEIVYSEEARDFAPYGDENQVIYRLIARKTQNEKFEI